MRAAFLLGSALGAVGAVSVATSVQAQVAGYAIPGETAADFNVAAPAREGAFARGGNIGVMQRPHSEWAAISIRLGAFELSPTMAVSAIGDDNIYAAADGVDGANDLIVMARPSALLSSNWSRNYVSLFARANSRTFLDHGGEDVVDWAVGSNNRLDIQRGAGVSAGGSFEQLSEPRTAPGAAPSVKPIRYTVAKGYFGGAKQFTRLRVSASTEVREYRYDEAFDSAGQALKEKSRDRRVVTANGRIEYAVNADKAVFVTATVNNRDFRTPGAGVSRGSSGYDVAIGANFDLSHLVRGDIQLGYLNQSYDDAQVKDVSGASLRGRLDYYATPLMTLSVSATQSIEDSDVQAAGQTQTGYLKTAAEFRLDYELRRNLILAAKAGFEHDEFRGADREDNRPMVGVSAHYLMNRSVGVVTGYDYLKQDSSGGVPGAQYDVNRVFVSLFYQF